MARSSLREALRRWQRRKRTKFTCTYLIDERTGDKEAYISCRTFAKQIGRAYRTVLRWARVGWIPAREVGDARYSFCLVPRKRAFQAFRKLLRDGSVSKV